MEARNRIGRNVLVSADRKRTGSAGHLDAATVKAAATGKWPSILAGLGVKIGATPNIHRECPSCGGTDRFRFVDQDGHGTFFCSQGNGETTGGDGFNLLRHVYRWSFPECLNAVAGYLGLTPATLAQTSPRLLSAANTDTSLTADRESRRVRDFLDATKRIDRAGEVAQYLTARGLGEILNDLPHDLREHAALCFYKQQKLAGRFAAMIAPIRDSEGKIVAAHRTYVHSGKKAAGRESKKLTGKVPKSSAIQLYAPTHRLAIAEGIESALAVRLMTGWPVWSGVNAGRLAYVEIPPSVRQIAIWADNDEAGYRAAKSLETRLKSEGRDVRIHVGKEYGMDALDLFLLKRTCAHSVPAVANTPVADSPEDSNAPQLSGDRCRCTVCGEQFNSTKAFDQHRVGEYGVNRRCLTAEEMIRAGMVRRPKGWITRDRQSR